MTVESDITKRHDKLSRFRLRHLPQLKEGTRMNEPWWCIIRLCWGIPTKCQHTHAGHAMHVHPAQRWDTIMTCVLQNCCLLHLKTPSFSSKLLLVSEPASCRVESCRVYKVSIISFVPNGAVQPVLSNLAQSFMMRTTIFYHPALCIGR